MPRLKNSLSHPIPSEQQLSEIEERCSWINGREDEGEDEVFDRDLSRRPQMVSFPTTSR